ncbi:MAG: hypothetical protein Q8T13_23490 [Acidobacteriota bacterium]|nr:hypothetical protein [Acidobacteriota bacterium]
MTLSLMLVLSLAGVVGLKADATWQAPAANKVEIVSVTGCLREQGAGNWVLVAATDPVPSVANQAPAAELPKQPPAGKNAFRLLGVGEFSFPQHRDRTMVIRGLFITAAPMSRINVTSAAEAVATCVAGAPK